MIKENMTYVDFNGNERNEDFYFNLTEAEALDMEMSTTGTLSQKIKSIMDSQDQPEIIKLFKEIILAAYGVKSPDGKYFVKNEKVRQEFESTQAFSDLYIKLASDANAAANFVNGVVPTPKKEPEDHAKKQTAPKLVEE